MGRLLDQWMQENSATLARLQPGGGMPPMGAAPPPAFGEGAGYPPGPQPAFPGSGMPPQAGPVAVGPGPGIAQVQAPGAFQPGPMAPPPQLAFEQGGGGEGGVPLGSAVMGAFGGEPGSEAAAAAGAGQEPAPVGPNGQPVIQGESEEVPATEDGEIRMPAEGESFSAQDAMSQTPEAVDKAVDMLEEQTGVPVEQHYEMVTGNPPPANTKRRQIGEFLFEFGLNLLARPAGGDDFSDVGTALQQTMGARIGRQQQAEATRKDDEQVAHERRMDLEELGLKTREIEALESGARGGSYADFTGQDGNLYTYDRRNGRATPVIGPDGNPIKARAQGGGSAAESVQRFNAVMTNRQRMAEIAGIPFEGPVEMEARMQAEEAMRGIRPSAEDDARTRQQALTDATRLLTASTEYSFMSPEEQATAREEMARSFFNYTKYGDFEGNVEAAAGEPPDASRLTQGMATPVTDEQGNTEYWTLGTNGQPRKVSAEELGQ